MGHQLSWVSRGPLQIWGHVSSHNPVSRSLTDLVWRHPHLLLLFSQGTLMNTPAIRHASLAFSTSLNTRNPHRHSRYTTSSHFWFLSFPHLPWVQKSRSETCPCLQRASATCACYCRRLLRSLCNSFPNGKVCSSEPTLPEAPLAPRILGSKSPTLCQACALVLQEDDLEKWLTRSPEKWIDSFAL